MISIHAPVKGATVFNRPSRFKEHNFNPRAREGRDDKPFSGKSAFFNFNPRAREGRDLM